ncbi:hypothetical protein GGS23DRAFT_566410, partial [Durotheca rogersii]|uniref:uncharacterized protein n=1 Tax=Durotheca rogersii TaxID=419775 RepID=UPI002220B314
MLGIIPTYIHTYIQTRIGILLAHLHAYIHHSRQYTHTYIPTYLSAWRTHALRRPSLYLTYTLAHVHDVHVQRPAAVDLFQACPCRSRQGGRCCGSLGQQEPALSPGPCRARDPCELLFRLSLSFFSFFSLSSSRAQRTGGGKCPRMRNRLDVDLGAVLAARPQRAGYFYLASFMRGRLPRRVPRPGCEPMCFFLSLLLVRRSLCTC